MLILLTFVAFLFIVFFQGDGSVSSGVVPIIEGVAAATTTGYLVGFYKKAFPTASDASIVAVAIIAGLFSAVVASMVNGGVPLTQPGIGVILLQGIGAAALSAGVQVANKPSVDAPKGL